MCRIEFVDTLVMVLHTNLRTSRIAIFLVLVDDDWTELRSGLDLRGMDGRQWFKSQEFLNNKKDCRSTRGLNVFMIIIT